MLRGWFTTVRMPFGERVMANSDLLEMINAQFKEKRVRLKDAKRGRGGENCSSVADLLKMSAVQTTGYVLTESHYSTVHW